MIKRIIACALATMLLISGCSTNTSNTEETTGSLPFSEATANASNNATDLPTATNVASEDPFVNDEDDEAPFIPEDNIHFEDLNDPKLMQYIQDNVYADLQGEFQSDNYQIENIVTSYVSKEYLEELEFNSRKNIYFGYTLAEIEEQFGDERFMFTLGDNGQTKVIKFEGYDDTFNKVLKNIAIGSGVILVCVTVSVVTAGAGAPVVSMIFAASAKTGITVALSTGTFAGVSAGVVTALETKDPEQTLKTMAVNASEGFKWGAIAGAVSGALSAATSAYLSDIPTCRESEARALKEFGGSDQISYLNGKEVPYGTLDSTRPDVVTDVLGHKEAIEVKNYDLESSASVSELYREVYREIGERAANLPDGFTQRVVLDIKGRGYSNELVQKIIRGIQITCKDIYPNLPVSVMV